MLNLNKLCAWVRKEFFRSHFPVQIPTVSWEKPSRTVNSGCPGHAPCTPSQKTHGLQWQQAPPTLTPKTLLRIIFKGVVTWFSFSCPLKFPDPWPCTRVPTHQGVLGSSVADGWTEVSKADLNSEAVLKSSGQGEARTLLSFVLNYFPCIINNLQRSYPEWLSVWLFLEGT